MRSLNISSMVLVLLAVVPSASRAQEGLPVSGTSAVGFDVGALAPMSDELSGSLFLNGLYEYYLTPRVSLRGDIGWTNPAFDVGAVNSLMQIPLRVSGTYNWEAGRWHPFATGGAGLYIVRFTADPPIGSSTDTKFGVSTGGGVEYFLSRTIAVKGEGRYHWVPDIRGEQLSGTTFAAGLKTYF
jgi:hypothetical protein